MKIVTGLETAKEQVKNNQITMNKVMRWIQDGIDYIELLEEERKKLNKIRKVMSAQQPMSYRLARIHTILEEEKK